MMPGEQRERILTLQNQVEYLGEQLRKLQTDLKAEEPRSFLTWRKLHRLEFIQNTINFVKQRLQMICDDLSAETIEAVENTHDAAVNEMLRHIAVYNEQTLEGVYTELENISETLRITTRHLEAL